MRGFKSFHMARRTLAGIALIHMLRKGQMDDGGGRGLTATEQFYALAAYFPCRHGKRTPKRLHTKFRDRTRKTMESNEKHVHAWIPC